MFTILQLDCATFDMPVDRTGAVGGTTKVRAIRAAATEGPRLGTLFVIAGGPGQPSDVMLDFMTSLFTGANRYDIIAVDLRGTGLSEPLDCPRIELGNFKFDGADPATDGPITACANALGPARFGYDTAESVEDIDAIRADLGLGQISLFGVSYGTKVALAYAGAHPASTKSLMIDSVLPVDQPGAFDTVSLEAMRKSLEEVCSGSRCRGVVSSPVAKLAKLAARLQRNPIDTVLVDANGKPQMAKIDDEALYELEFAADFDLFIYNQLPATLDAALRGNSAPLERLFAILSGGAGATAKKSSAKRFTSYLPKRRHQAGARYKAGTKLRGRAEVDVAAFSNTLNLTTSCEDFIGPWGRGAALPGRQNAIDAAVNALPASAIYPFPRTTVRNESLSTICRGYSESPAPPALVAGPMPPVPTLALDGSLDVRTPVAWAKQAIAGNPNATLAVIPHTGHSTIGTDVSGCALSLAKRFLIFGAVDGKCSRSALPIPVARRAVTSTNSVRPLSGSCRGLRGRRCASAKKAVTAGYLAMRDALDQYVIGGAFEGPGLYGGGWFLESDLADDLFTEIPVAIEMDGLAQVPDVIASGRLAVEDFPKVDGHFSVDDFGGRSYRVDIRGRFAYDQKNDRVTITARGGGKVVVLRRRGAGGASARVSIHNLKVRSNYQRAVLLSRGFLR